MFAIIYSVRVNESTVGSSVVTRMYSESSLAAKTLLFLPVLVRMSAYQVRTAKAPEPSFMSDNVRPEGLPGSDNRECAY